MVPYVKERVVLDARSGAVSGPVRVSYFDPRTGEPSPTKCPPLSDGVQEERVREQEGRRASMGRGRRCRAVLVDGVELESINAAARLIGCSNGSLGDLLRSGGGVFRGREVRFADGSRGVLSDAPPERLKGHYVRAVTVDGELFGSIKDAAAEVGCVPGAIHNALKKGRGSVKGREVAYARGGRSDG